MWIFKSSWIQDPYILVCVLVLGVLRVSVDLFGDTRGDCGFGGGGSTQLGSCA